MTARQPKEPSTAWDEKRMIKCVVWDLDHTLWDGVLLEDREVRLRHGVAELIRALDERGILQSVASKNEPEVALAKLAELGLADYFLYPQIHWGSKAGSIAAIAKSLNFGIDAIAFVDDQPFERDEVRFSHPTVMCIDAADVAGMLDLPEMKPRFITDDSRRRRQMYLADLKRTQEEASHPGTPAEFLASLQMRLVIDRARREDLQRAEELTVRTNQLNTTGYTYSYDELDGYRTSPEHELWVASLEDKYGSYGKIGLGLVERGPQIWNIKLLLMSCRVASRGVGSALISFILNRAKAAGVRLQAEFIPTDRNRMMYITYKLSGFHAVAKTGRGELLEHDLSGIQAFPPYLQISIDGVAGDE